MNTKKGKMFLDILFYLSYTVCMQTGGQGAMHKGTDIPRQTSVLKK